MPRRATRAYARKLWRVCQPAIGTQGEAYLRGLGINHPVPVAFRYATRLEHWPTGTAYPALVCAMRWCELRGRRMARAFGAGPARARLERIPAAHHDLVTLGPAIRRSFEWLIAGDARFAPR